MIERDFTYYRRVVLHAIGCAGLASLFCIAIYLITAFVFWGFPDPEGGVVRFFALAGFVWGMGFSGPAYASRKGRDDLEKKRYRESEDKKYM